MATMDTTRESNKFLQISFKSCSPKLPKDARTYFSTYDLLKKVGPKLTVCVIENKAKICLYFSFFFYVGDQKALTKYLYDTVQT